MLKFFGESLKKIIKLFSGKPSAPTSQKKPHYFAKKLSPADPER